MDIFVYRKSNIEKEEVIFRIETLTWSTYSQHDICDITLNNSQCWNVLRKYSKLISHTENNQFEIMPHILNVTHLTIYEFIQHRKTCFVYMKGRSALSVYNILFNAHK